MDFDVVIVGGGPAGISAGIELSRHPEFTIGLFDSETELGGIPRSCHYPLFGLRDQKMIYTGPAYTRHLNALLRKTKVKIHTEATVVNIDTIKHGELHQVDVLSREGLRSYKCRAVLVATGCFENSRSARMIPGTRPAGIFTTGTIQELVNFYSSKPGHRALIIGSETVAFSCLLTLKRAGVSIVGMIEEDEELQTYPALARAASLFFHFPIYRGFTVKAILGDKRVEMVELETKAEQKIFQIRCDTVVITGKFRPYSVLFDKIAIEKDLLTYGPVVDINMMTSIPNIFAAGNVLRGADTHDLCALEGKQAAKSIMQRLTSGEYKTDQIITVHTEWPIKYVVPQKIIQRQIEYHRPSLFHPGISLYMGNTLKNAVLECWSADKKIWERSYSKLIKNSRIPLPIRKFDWGHVNNQQGITLRVRPSNS